MKGTFVRVAAGVGLSGETPVFRLQWRDLVR